MRRLIALVGVVAVGCAEPTPTSTDGPSTSLAPSLSVGSDGAPPTVFNTLLLGETEIPINATESKGHSHFIVRADGVIESQVTINNKGDEVVRFCHIHWITPNPTPPTLPGNGPIIWWLTSPTLVNLGLTDRHIDLRVDAADYVAGPFGPDNAISEAAARAALLADPSKFYVNCHSNASPGGFVRGNLP